MSCTSCGPSLLAQTGHVNETLAPTGAALSSAATAGGSFSFDLPWLLVLLFVAMYAGRKIL
jgi:hypothetical protein